MTESTMAAEVIKLPEVLDLNALEALHTELLSKRGVHLELDASAVSGLGAQGLQLLLSASETWRLDQKSFTVSGAGDEFVSAVSMMGVDADVLCLDGEEHE